MLVFRKSLLLPAEHGSWAWLLVPYFAGVALAGRFNLAAFLILIGGLALFLARQPLTVWLRAQRGRGRRADGPLARNWTAVLLLVSGLSFLALLALGRTGLLWLLLPLVFILFACLLVANRGRAATRSLWMEIVGAAGLAMMAPAAMIAASGEINTLTWVAWGLMAALNALGVFYVRLRIADTHGREVDRRPILWVHAAGLLLVLAAGAWVPWPAALPFVAFLVRAVWAVVRPRPVAHMKRFGFSEVGVEIISAAWIVASFQ